MRRNSLDNSFDDDMNRDNHEYESLNGRPEHDGLFSGSPMFRNNHSDLKMFEEPSQPNMGCFLKGTEYDLFGQIEQQVGPSKRDLGQASRQLFNFEGLMNEQVQMIPQQAIPSFSEPLSPTLNHKSTNESSRTLFSQPSKKSFHSNEGSHGLFQMTSQTLDQDINKMSNASSPSEAQPKA